MIEPRDIDLSAIRTDGGTQIRVDLDKEVFLEYGTRMASGEKFPPVDVFFDGTTFWLADGFHRFYGASAADQHTISAIVHDGSVRDAILFACKANAFHGLRRTNADKRHAVETLLEDTKWRKWSDRKIAEACSVTHPFVGSVRAEWQAKWNRREAARKRRDSQSQLVTVTSFDEDLEKRVGRDGKVRGRKQSAPASVSASAPDSAPASSFDWPDDEPAAPLAQAPPADALPTVEPTVEQVVVEPVDKPVVESVDEPVARRLSKNAINQLRRFDNALRDCYLKLERVNVPIRHPVKSALSVAWEAYRALHKAIETERNQ